MRAVILLMVLVAAPAFAAPKSARDYYSSATSHYNLSEWQAALDDFREAYRLKPDPAFLFNIAQCQRQLGNYREAAQFYRAFRREGVASADVDRLIADMDKAAEAQRQREEAAEREKAAKAPPTNLEVPPPSGTTTTTPANNELTASAPPREKPLVKKPWFWITVGAAAVVVVGVGVGLGVGLSGSSAHDPATPTIGVIR